MRFAIIGAGKIASKFCEAVRMTDGAELAAVGSKDPERARLFAETNGVPLHFGSYEEMLGSAKIDAVYISTTHNFHYDNIKLCLSKGKHVLCEKSMVTCKSDAVELFAIAKEKGLLLAEGMWIRHLDALKTVKKWISDGEIGDITLASMVAGFRAEVPDSHRLVNPALGGGVVFDIAVYAIETATYLFGEDIKNVLHTLHRGQAGSDMTVNLLLDYGGFTASLICTLAGGQPTDLLVSGSGGYIRMPSFIGGAECFLHKTGQEPVHFTAPYQNGFQFELAEFIRCVREGRTESQIMPAQDTTQCAEIFDVLLS
ncbi:MAG: Gfo/Idh/MocA family oxidoreductase [Oscillospiraceae bacterium]|nr:Gfo/Idh/MocA family oxidoreductase [Oscillospiraceae bacterium]